MMTAHHPEFAGQKVKFFSAFLDAFTSRTVFRQTLHEYKVGSLAAAAPVSVAAAAEHLPGTAEEAETCKQPKAAMKEKACKQRNIADTTTSSFSQMPAPLPAPLPAPQPVPQSASQLAAIPSPPMPVSNPVSMTTSVSEIGSTLPNGTPYSVSMSNTALSMHSAAPNETIDTHPALASGGAGTDPAVLTQALTTPLATTSHVGMADPDDSGDSDASGSGDSGASDSGMV